jgi:hypothetical protein
MRRYALFAVAAPGGVRVFATTRPVETGEAGPALFRVLTTAGLRNATIAAGVTTDRPAGEAAVLIEAGIVRSVALVDSGAAAAIRALAENIGADVTIVTIEPLGVPEHRPAAAHYAVPIAFCMECEDHPARGDGGCTACEGLAALRRRGFTSES